MSLPLGYLDYPHRSYGMDQDRYAWRPAPQRQALSGPAVSAMIVLPIEHHTLEPVGKPFKHPGAMQTPYPDLRHYTTRDYGNRVGVFRILDALKAEGLKATFPVNARQLVRLRPVIDAVLADGHEIAAYGLSTDHIHWGGLDRAEEAAWVAEVRARFVQAGLGPKTWLSPARQQSFATLDLIAAEGFDVCLDWEIDEVPVAFKTEAGPVTALPLLNELDDRTLLIDRRQTEDEWADQILAAASLLGEDADRFGARMFGFTLTPYVTGQPFRIAALRRMLAGLKAAGVRCATASELQA
jgi:peptidoglycan/xylan/chitin deacetylase (PgdA/CDA1 family)